MTYDLQPEPHDELSRRLTHALETPCGVQIPPGFAARTAALARQAAPSVRERARFSSLAIQLSFAVLIVAMLGLNLLARRPSEVAIVTEIALALEFVALTTWLSLRPHR
jgi:hypothetical protein